LVRFRNQSLGEDFLYELPPIRYPPSNGSTSLNDTTTTTEAKIKKRSYIYLAMASAKTTTTTTAPTTEEPPSQGGKVPASPDSAYRHFVLDLNRSFRELSL
jgi:hypothetical protein